MQKNTQERRIYRIHDLAELFSVHQATIFRWIKQKRLPEPIRVSLRYCYWPASEIDAMIGGTRESLK